MLIHVLGGGAGQLNAVRRCRQSGLEVLVTDMNPAAPGCLEADYFQKASTFSPEETIEALHNFRRSSEKLPDAMLVTGTDQPVLTAALTAENLDISYFLKPDQARLLTNKRSMKDRLSSEGIPVSPYAFVFRGGGTDRFSHLNFPVVVKPLDSQGQRGVYRLETADEVVACFDEVVGYSRENEIMVEEYYESDEITVSGWVENGILYILSVTDRRTVSNLPSIGVCVAHQYPSRYDVCADNIRQLTEDIVSAFGIEKGPIYFQYLVGDRGIIVNETAARLGGAYEDEFLPYIIGFDILDVMIRMSCGLGYDRSFFNGIGEFSLGKIVSVQMFFCCEGTIASQEGMETILQMPGIIGGKFLLAPGTEIAYRKNSTQRAGYFIVCCRSRDDADEIVKEAYSNLRINDKNGKNMIIVYDNMFFGG